MFEEYDFRKKDGNKILQAVGEGFSSGFNFGIWYAALSPEPQKVQSVAGEGADLALLSGNTYQYMDTYVIPKGTTIFEGTVASNLEDTSSMFLIQR